MGCFSSKPALPDPPRAAAREVTSPRPPPLPVPQSQSSSSEPTSRQSHANPGRRSLQVDELHMREPTPRRFRSKSTPQKPPAMKGVEDLPPVPVLSERSRTKSSVTPSHRRPSTPATAEHPHPKSFPKRPALSYPSLRPLNSTLQQMLPDNFKFRILVVGKRGSGKSSLIKSVFKVDVTAASERAPGKADMDVGVCPEDNRYLIVHEGSGLDPRARDPQDLQAIQTFISRRTDATCSPPERLHAIWICVPASDAVDGKLGDGVEEILAIRNVPVILVLTKFDVLVSKARLDVGDDHERARARAYTMYEDLCRQTFRKEPRDVPAEIVSKNESFVDLIENLVITTDRFVTGSRASSSRAATKQRLGAVPLAWSVAVRMNHDIIIQASIEVGRSQYWLSLCPDFMRRTLKDCVNIIHDDIVRIWNLNDKTRYLTSDEFKAKMSHLVKDLAGSSDATSSSDKSRAADAYTDWVYDVYKGRRPENRCVVGYIVDLTVILDGIFRMATCEATGEILPIHAEQILEKHVSSGRRDAIHWDIRSFLKEAFAIRFSVPRKDLVLEKIIDLIKQYCVPHP